MSYLSEALARYYARKGNRIVFCNRLSLNRFALLMWEHLGFQQIDASALSRVLKGERLFTTMQLKTFCSILNLSAPDQGQLFAALQKDIQTKFGLPEIGVSIPRPIYYRVLDSLVEGSFSAFYAGDYSKVAEKHALFEQLLPDIYRHAPAERRGFGLHLYLRGRVATNGEVASKIVKKTAPIIAQMLEIQQSLKNAELYGYVHILQANMYYLAGGYSEAEIKKVHYAKAFDHAKQALSYFSSTHHESLFALRIMAASAYYLRDSHAVVTITKEVKKVIVQQPLENYINGLHLSLTLGKCMAGLNLPDPTKIVRLATSHFKRDLRGTGVYEVSALKEEVDTLLLLKASDTNYIAGRLREALSLSELYDFARQKKYLKKLLRAI